MPGRGQTLIVGQLLADVRLASDTLGCEICRNEDARHSLVPTDDRDGAPTMLGRSDISRPDETPKSVGDPPAPPRAPEGGPPSEPATPPVKGDRSDALTKEGDAGDKLGDFA